jgi:hypothetical protein
VQGGRERGIGQERTGPPFFNSKWFPIAREFLRRCSFAAVLAGKVQGGRERGICQERTGPPFFNSKWFPIARELLRRCSFAAVQAGKARRPRAYRAAFLQFKMVSDSKGVTQAVQFRCRASREGAKAG